MSARPTQKYTHSITIFLSSTFQDLCAERDIIVSYVVPRVQVAFDRLGIKLVVIDLRWGISRQEAQQGKVLELCLREIDKSRPLFIGIVGKRYGWQPDMADFKASSVLQTEYPSVEKYFQRGYSITEMEMQYAVLDGQKKAKSLFLIDTNYSLTSNENQQRLSNLIDKIEDKASKAPQECSVRKYAGNVGQKKLDTFMISFITEWLMDIFQDGRLKDLLTPIIPANDVQTRQQRYAYVQDELKRNGKSLTSEQLDLILNSPNARTFKGLQSVLQDILVFGVFENLDSFITWRTQVSAIEYEAYSIDRAINMMGGQTRKILTSLAVSQYGLSSGEIRHILNEQYIDVYLQYLHDKQLIYKNGKEVWTLNPKKKNLITKRLFSNEQMLQVARLELIMVFSDQHFYRIEDDIVHIPRVFEDEKVDGNGRNLYRNPSIVLNRKRIARECDYQKKKCTLYHPRTPMEAWQDLFRAEWVGELGPEAFDVQHPDFFRRIMLEAHLYLDVDETYNPVKGYEVLQNHFLDCWCNDDLMKHFTDAEILTYQERMLRYYHLLQNTENEYVWECSSEFCDNFIKVLFRSINRDE